MRKRNSFWLIGSALFLLQAMHSASASKIVETIMMNKSEKPAVEKSLDEPLPEWVKDSKKLSELLGGKVVGNVKDAKVIKRYETPIPGLDALAVAANVYQNGEIEPKQELFVFYVDKSGRYMVAGLLIDMEEGRNYSQVVERYTKGSMVDNPALALSPLEMNGVESSLAKKDNGVTLTIVVDVSPEKGRSNLLKIHELREKLIKKGKAVAKLRIVPVSNGNDEQSTGAMALSLGFDVLKPGEGYDKLIEFSAKGKKTEWMSKDSLRKNKELKAAMGLGIFKLEENSTQALLAKLNTLPLIYAFSNNQLNHVLTPSSESDWELLLTKTSFSK